MSPMKTGSILKYVTKKELFPTKATLIVLFLTLKLFSNKLSVRLSDATSVKQITYHWWNITLFLAYSSKSVNLREISI